MAGVGGLGRIVPGRRDGQGVAVVADRHCIPKLVAIRGVWVRAQRQRCAAQVVACAVPLKDLHPAPLCCGAAVGRCVQSRGNRNDGAVAVDVHHPAHLLPDIRSIAGVTRTGPVQVLSALHPLARIGGGVHSCRDGEAGVWANIVLVHIPRVGNRVGIPLEDAHVAPVSSASVVQVRAYDDDVAVGADPNALLAVAITSKAVKLRIHVVGGFAVEVLADLYPRALWIVDVRAAFVSIGPPKVAAGGLSGAGCPPVANVCLILEILVHAHSSRLDTGVACGAVVAVHCHHEPRAVVVQIDMRRVAAYVLAVYGLCSGQPLAVGWPVEVHLHAARVAVGGVAGVVASL